jgi:hypothetical protein
MAQNSEQIEAKLCAYLEGELDEAGRAEIEKHLQQNPAHRRLLAEVGKTRDLLRALPREPAPPDICEAFQGQLERSVLLADLNTEQSTTSMKINRWPQYFAVAAVVMLAAGLGLVVYFGLPSSAPRGTYATGGGAGGGAAVAPVEDGVAKRSDAEAPAPPTTSAIATTELAAVPPDPGAVPPTIAPIKRETAAAPQEETAELGKRSLNEGLVMAQKPAASAPAAPAAPSLAQDLPTLARRVQGAWEPVERERLFRKDAGGSDSARQALASVADNALCFRVTTDQPAQAGEEITQKLSELSVAWQAYPQPDPAAVQTKLDAARGFAMGGAAPAAKSESLAEVDASAGQPPAGASAGRPVQQQVTLPPEKKQAELAVQAPAASGPAVPAQQESRVANAASAPAPAEGAPAQGRESDTFAAAARPQTLIVARNLTRQQAETLGIALNETRAARQVTVHAGLPVVQRGLAASDGDDALIQRGDALRVVTRGGGGEQNVTEVQVRPDGVATLPVVGDFRCAGLTVAQVQQHLSADDQAAAAGGEQVVSVSKVKPADDGGAREPVANDAVALRDAGEDRGVRRSRGDLTVRMRSAQIPERPSPAPTRGGAGGAAAGAAGRRVEEPLAAGAAPVVSDAELSPTATQSETQAATPAPATAPSEADERFDVVIVVEGQPDATQPATQDAAPQDAAPQPAPAEPAPTAPEPRPGPDATAQPDSPEGKAEPQL